MSLTIDPHRCPANHRCPLINVCPMEAISQNPSGLPVIDEEKCAECLDCADYCPTQAVRQK